MQKKKRGNSSKKLRQRLVKKTLTEKVAGIERRLRLVVEKTEYIYKYTDAVFADLEPRLRKLEKEHRELLVVLGRFDDKVDKLSETIRATSKSAAGLIEADLASGNSQVAQVLLGSYGALAAGMARQMAVRIIDEQLEQQRIANQLQNTTKPDKE